MANEERKNILIFNELLYVRTNCAAYLKIYRLYAR